MRDRDFLTSLRAVIGTFQAHGLEKPAKIVMPNREALLALKKQLVANLCGGLSNNPKFEECVAGFERYDGDVIFLNVIITAEDEP